VRERGERERRRESEEEKEVVRGGVGDRIKKTIIIYKE